ncbi:hypothetical protein BDN70DRAFT_684646 [Pholiota conissans]|uniref:Uncharacterized protein n=1 Tax=Pholiota conissans TaxID=109636 RepID=A0A9P5Z3E4_9AGAR|nr:hypothetical protein BDN70DRAFT_684646 [Pholiota conissans]
MQTLTGILVEVLFDDSTRNDAALVLLSSELQAMDVNNIEDVEIEITLRMDSDCLDEWANLDGALSQHAWPKLKRFSLRIEVWSSSTGRVDLFGELEDLPQRHFPKLSSNKAITFKFEVGEELQEFYHHIANLH